MAPEKSGILWGVPSPSSKSPALHFHFVHDFRLSTWDKLSQPCAYNLCCNLYKYIYTSIPIFSLSYLGFPIDCHWSSEIFSGTGEKLLQRFVDINAWERALAVKHFFCRVGKLANRTTKGPGLKGI